MQRYKHVITKRVDNRITYDSDIADIPFDPPVTMQKKRTKYKTDTKNDTEDEKCPTNKETIHSTFAHGAPTSCLQRSFVSIAIKGAETNDEHVQYLPFLFVLCAIE